MAASSPTSSIASAIGSRQWLANPPARDGLVLFGCARTGLYMEVYHVLPGANPYELEIALVDDLKPGDVAVLGCPGGRVAPWGEAAQHRVAGARGGGVCHRRLGARRAHDPLDGVPGLRRRDRPARNSRGRGQVMQIDVPIRCGGARVAPATGFRRCRWRARHLRRDRRAGDRPVAGESEQGKHRARGAGPRRSAGRCLCPSRYPLTPKPIRGGPP